jgi:hypothetical protein
LETLRYCSPAQAHVAYERWTQMTKVLTREMTRTLEVGSALEAHWLVCIVP